MQNVIWPTMAPGSTQGNPRADSAAAPDGKGDDFAKVMGAVDGKSEKGGSQVF